MGGVKYDHFLYNLYEIRFITSILSLGAKFSEISNWSKFSFLM